MRSDARRSWARTRSEKVEWRSSTKKTVEIANEYQVAFTHDPEADYKQEQLDAALREIWKDELQPFYERYPYIKKIDYTKPIKGGNKG